MVLIEGMNTEQDHSKKNSAFRILVVDDEPKNINLLIKLLKDRGYQTRAARDGEFAIQTLQKEPVDLILKIVVGLDVAVGRPDPLRYHDARHVRVRSLHDTEK